MAFTLIELLIVIAVIAMLLGILVPISHTAREQTRAVMCGANLKQVCLALTTYDQENETLPYGFDDLTYVTTAPPGGYVGEASRDKMGWWWFHLLYEALGKNFGQQTVVWCPSRCVRDLGPKANVLCGNYAVNRAICKDAPGTTGGEFVGKPLGLYQIRSSAETLLITDSGYSLISWRGATNAAGQPFENTQREGAFYVPGLAINNQRLLEGAISPSCERDAIDGRHPNRSVNVGFTDGHTARVEADDLFVEENDDSYSNLSPLWLPK